MGRVGTEGLAGSVQIVAHLHWDTRPELHQPVVIAAFEGWNDAGEAATAAVAYLIQQWTARSFAWIDPEEFYDFTATRPTVRMVGDSDRVVDWPDNRFHATDGGGRVDVVLVRGVEPQLRWKTFSRQVLDVATALDARLVLTLGALLADVPHTRPTAVFGTSSDPVVIDALHLEPSRYEGPTGIVGVLHEECRDRGINSASLWATVPSYVASAPSPQAAMALVEGIGGMLGIEVPVGPLVDAAAEYQDQITELVSEDADTVAYVRHLEEQHDSDGRAVESVADLVAEVERFLREQ
jgi:predicted ATP-grasp superfamily ATP-dependent carboligase